MAQLLTPVFTNKFKKQFGKLPQTLQTRFNTKLSILLSDPKHPGFHSRKMGGVNQFEARLTEHYRFTYAVIENEIWFLTVGSHDKGLGKK